MLVAGLIDAGAPRAALEPVLAALLPGEFTWELRAERRHNIAGTRFVVQAREGHVHRRLADVLRLLERAPLRPRARAWAETAFRELATAEGKCHALAPEQVHFHEVGAVDAVVDVAAACTLMDALDPVQIWCSPVAVGSGTVDCAHGRMPVPAPGTLELLRGMPVTGRSLQGERATPTGVALLRAFGARFGTRAPAVVQAVGYGLGARDTPDLPNFLRVLIEQAEGAPEHLYELVTLVDDQSGEVIGAALEALHAAGAVDAYAVAALGKKGRPAYLITVLCSAERRLEFEDLLYQQLGTLGLRVQAVSRSRRPRASEVRPGPLGPLTWKVRHDPDGTSAKPEFGPLRRRAGELGWSPRQARERLADSDSAQRE